MVTNGAAPWRPFLRLKAAHRESLRPEALERLRWRAGAIPTLDR